MNKLNPSDLYSLEEYHKIRDDFRSQVIDHKRDRKLPIGPNATLYFEDRLTMQYQIQEMLRIERIFEAEGIREELDAYNPLIPDGSNWKATFMVEFPDAEQRRVALSQLTGIENLVWMQVEGHERVYAIADEDLDRASAEKTSAVHFMRFELSTDMVAALRAGASLSAGIHHSIYDHQVNPVSAETTRALLGDLT
jgi:hypothetical protein